MKIFLNSLILAVLNLLSVLVGFYVFFISKTQNQLAIQAPVACVFSVLSFLSWKFLCHKLLKKVNLKSQKEYIFAYFFSLVWSPIIFVPMHYLTQGYLTSWQNITGIWLFQIPTNILVLKVNHSFELILDLKEKLIRHEKVIQHPHS